MSNIKISIIVPVYNVENYIKNTLDSILNQTLKDIEIIAINDGSTDNTKNILDSYSKKFDRIKVIHQENKGVSATRNKGILYAKGEYIGFVDADDLIDCNMYETLYKKATFNNADIAICGFIEEDLKGNVFREYSYKYSNKILIDNDIRKSFKESLDTELSPLGGASICNKIFKRKLLTDNKILIDESITVGEDFCLNIHCFDKAKSVVGVDEKFYHYMKINPNSIMTKMDDTKFYKFIEGRKAIIKTLNDFDFDSEEYLRFENGRNFANLIQIADYKIKQSNDMKKSYKITMNILKSDEFKSSIKLSSDKYLSKNLQLIKKLSKSNLNSIIFSIIYIRAKK